MLRPIAASLLLAIAAVANAAPNVQIAFQHGKRAAIGEVTGTEIDVSNTGPDAATNVVVTYTPAAQLTYAAYRTGQYSSHPDPTITASCVTPRPGDSGTITCTIPTLPSNRTVYFLVFLNVPPSIAPGTSLTHTATSGTQTITFSNTAEPLPQLEMSNTFPKTVVAGAPYDYTVSVHNASNFDATNVSFSATTDSSILAVRQSAGTPSGCPQFFHPGDNLVCQQMTIRAGDTLVFSITQKSDPESAGFFDSVDTTLWPTDFFEEGYQDVTTTAPLTAYPDPAVTITAPEKATVNTPYVVHVMAYAAGPSMTRNTTLTFTTPPGTTFNSIADRVTDLYYSTSYPQCSTPPAGASGTITCTMLPLTPAYLEQGIGGRRTELDIKLTPTATGTVTANATVSAPNDLDPTNDSASATTTIVSGPVADLSLTLLRTASNGTDATYSAAVTNVGSTPATNVVLSITLPSGATSTNSACSGTPLVCTQTYASLTPLSQQIFTFSMHAPAAATSLTVSGRVSEAEEEANAANNQASVTSYFGNANGGDLTLTATVGDAYGNQQPLPAAVAPGTPITYTVATTTAGSTVTLTIPNGSTFVTTPPGSVNGNSITTATTPFTAVATAPQAPGSYTTQVTMSGSTRVATVPIVVAAGAQLPVTADLSVVVAPPLLVQPGDEGTYAVSVLNRGSQPASNVRLTVTLPQGATLDHIDAPSGTTCSGTPIVCSTSSLANGATVTVNVVVRPPAVGLGSMLPMSASATSDTADPNSANNRFAAATTIAYPTKLAMRVDPANVALPPGVQFVTTITVTNEGRATVSGLTISDFGPSALKALSVNSTPNATCAHASFVSCTASVLNPGEQIVITAVLQAPQSGTVTQGRYVGPGNAPDIASAEVLTYQTVVITAHPKHRAAP